MATKRKNRSTWRLILRLMPYIVSAAIGGAVVVAVMSLGDSFLRSKPAPAGPDHRRASPNQYDWSTLPEPAFPIPPYAKYLTGVKIVLDAGHGGRADRVGWKRGPTGLREAEVNLRVALFLREFLLAAGAEVTLTRDSDVYLDEANDEDLRKRIEIANDVRADLFLSIHHNGADNSPDANYTSVFFHGEPDLNPASVALARHVLSGVNDALRLDQHLPCGVVSDFAIYPGKGFAVLRQSRVPAVLSESSFHSNPSEESRLRDPVYNRREAYGQFLGLARWARDGLPRVRLIDPADGQVRSGQPIVVQLDDGLSARGGLGSSTPKLLLGTLTVEFSGKPLAYKLDPKKNEIRFTPSREMLREPTSLRVDFANMFGQHVIHPWIELNPAQ